MTIITADLYDEHGEDLQSVSLQFLSLGGVRAFSGPIRTVRCFEDNALLKTTLSTPGQGAVLVVDGQGSLETALLGDMIAQIASENHWAGVVINGAVRDRSVLADMPLGIKALGSNPRKSTKTGEGEVDVDVTFAGTTFTPGATIYCDDDGILVTRTGAI